MSGPAPDRKESGFKQRTRVDAARSTLRSRVDTIDRTRRVGLDAADGLVLADGVTAERNVPHYRRAAMDGYAVSAADTFGASDRSPAVLRRHNAHDSGDELPALDPGTAVRVHTGSELPDGADAVVMVEHTEAIGDELEVFDAVAEGDNVAPVGEDVEAGTQLFDPGHRLRPSDLGLCKSAGVESVTAYDQPRVAVLPTGEELVQDDPEPGTIVETNGLTVSRLVDRWGGTASYREVTTDDKTELEAAIERDLDHDIIVTTGGSSVGERDLLPEVIDGLGEVLVHGVALEPGHPVAFGIVEETPVIALPGYPVACIVNAVQFLRPAISWLQGTTPDPLPTMEAVLDRKLPSEPGIRTFARVSVEPTDDSDPLAVPTRTSGSGVLSSVAMADGWVVIEEASEGIPAGTTVSVQYWEVTP